MREALPLMWRNIPERYNLLGSRCETCGKAYYPMRKVCPTCRRKGRLVEAKMPETGKILSYSEVFVAPTGFDHETPYFLAIVELDNKATLLSQIVDSKREKIREGARVELLFRKIYEDSPEGAIAYGYKFKVV